MTVLWIQIYESMYESLLRIGLWFVFDRKWYHTSSNFNKRVTGHWRILSLTYVCVCYLYFICLIWFSSIKAIKPRLHYNFENARGQQHNKKACIVIYHCDLKFVWFGLGRYTYLKTKYLYCFNISFTKCFLFRFYCHTSAHSSLALLVMIKPSRFLSNACLSCCPY